MKKITTLLAVSALALAVAAPSFAASTPAPAGAAVMMSDHSMRASKLIGAPVFNDQGEAIGTISDVLVPTSGGETRAVLSVGDFVGAGGKLVAVPLSHVNMDGAKMTMAGATKPMLASMPGYSFQPLFVGGSG